MILTRVRRLSPEAPRSWATAVTAATVLIIGIVGLPGPAHACSPAESDWRYVDSSPGPDEQGVPTNTWIWVSLERDAMNSGAWFGSEDIHLICDGREVGGTWEHGGGPRRNSLWWSDSAYRWNETRGHVWPDYSDSANMTFDATEPIPADSSCQVVLDRPCGWTEEPSQCFTFMGRQYPWTIYSFATGAGPSDTPPSISQIRIRAVAHVIKEIECDQPQGGACTNCRSDERTGWGVEFSWPEEAISPGRHLYRMQEVGVVGVPGGAIDRSSWGGDTFFGGRTRVAFSLGEVKERPRCVKFWIEDLNGVSSVPTDPVCCLPLRAAGWANIYSAAGELFCFDPYEASVILKPAGCAAGFGPNPGSVPIVLVVLALCLLVRRRWGCDPS